MKVRLYKPSYLPDAYQCLYIPLSKIPYIRTRINIYELSMKFSHSLVGFIIDKFFSLFQFEDDVIIEEHDTFNCDHSLTQIIYPLLKQFRKHLHGCPSILDVSDLPEHLTQSVSEEMAKDEDDRNKDWTGELDKSEWMKMKAWEWIIDEMIWAFEQLSKDGNDDQFYKKVEIDHKYMDMPCHRLECDKESLKKHHERIQNGLRLFGFYYRNLWN